MHLVYRPAALGDVDACARLVPDALYALAPGLRALLPAVWRRWLRDGAGQLTVIEDAECPEGARLVAFGSSVFVSETFAADARTCLPPPVLTQLARATPGAASPVLSAEAVRAANSGAGLCVLVPIIGWDETALDDDEVRWVKARLIEAFFYRHAGYRVQEFLQEVYSQEEMERGHVIGIQVRTDYASFFTAASLPSPERRPYLVGLTKEECRDSSMISPLFLYAPPRFAFRPGEQDVLCLALLDQSDDEIAATLHVSPGTIHKRWQAIHARVARQAPDWFPAADAAPDAPRTRGAEKRRRLLSYLRSHPEELRPAHVSRRRRAP